MFKSLNKIFNKAKRALNIKYITKSSWGLFKIFISNIRKYYIHQVVLCIPFMVLYFIYQYWNRGLDDNVGFVLTIIMAFLSILAIYRYYWDIGNSDVKSSTKSGFVYNYKIIRSSGERLYTGLMATLVMLISLAIYITSFALFINMIIYILDSPRNILVWVLVIMYIPFSLSISRLYFGLLSLPFGLYIGRQSFKQALLNSWNSYRHNYFLFATIATIVSFIIIFIVILLLGQGAYLLDQHVFRGDIWLPVKNTITYINYILILNLYIIFAKSIYEYLLQHKSLKK